MQIGGYEVVKELGRGGMGVVYAVRSPNLPGLRALKLLLQSADAEAQLRFRREAELQARVRHPGIVRIHEVGESEAGLYLVMDLVEGQPLDEVLRRGPVEPEQARKWTLEVADAVAALHANGLLHRDLKPANLMLCPDGRILLLDFGLARGTGRSSLTNTGAIAGSPGYMAPEQADGQSNLTPAVDVHGLGAILFALLTGGAPFAASSVFEGLQRVLNTEAEWPAGLPDDLVSAGRIALAKKPSERYSDAGAFALALRAPPDSGQGSPSLLALGLASLVVIVLLLGGTWAALSASRSADLTSPTPLAASATPTPSSTISPLHELDLTRPPPDGRARADWYRAAWREAGRRELSLDERRSLKSVQGARLLDLSVGGDEAPRAMFWGSSHWARHRKTGLDWGPWGASVSGPSGGQALPAGFAHPEGQALWTFHSRGWSVWRSPGPGQSLTALKLPLPKDQESARAKSGLTLAAIASQGERLALASQWSVWELKKSQIETLLVGSDNEIVELGYLPGGSLIARCKAGGASRVFFPRRPLVSGLVTQRRANCMAIHPQQDLIVLGHNLGLITTWRPSDREAVPIGEPGGPSIAVEGIAFGPKGDFIYAVAVRERSGRGQLQVWRREQESWTESRQQALAWPADCLEVSPDGAWLLISGPGGKAELWPAGDRGY